MPLPPKPAPPELKTVIGQPLPQPSQRPAESPRARRERERNEAEIRLLIREELEAKALRQKNAAETASALSELVGQLRLAQQQKKEDRAPKAKAPGQAPQQPPGQWKFRVSEAFAAQGPETTEASDLGEYDESDGYASS